MSSDRRNFSCVFICFHLFCRFFVEKGIAVDITGWIPQVLKRPLPRQGKSSRPDKEGLKSEGKVRSSWSPLSWRIPKTQPWIAHTSGMTQNDMLLQLSRIEQISNQWHGARVCLAKYYSFLPISSWDLHKDLLKYVEKCTESRSI